MIKNPHSTFESVQEKYKYTIVSESETQMTVVKDLFDVFFNYTPPNSQRFVMK